MMLGIFFLIIMFSIDNFLVSTSYSIKGISISLKYIFIICLTTTLSLLLSFTFSDILKLFLSDKVVKFIGFFILFSLGIYNMFQDKIKIYVSNKRKNGFIDVYLDETKADFDDSKSLGLNETLVLSFVLSLDSLVGGISMGILNLNVFCVLTIMFVINFIFFILGKYIGKYLNRYVQFNLSYLFGFIVILVALLNFI